MKPSICNNVLIFALQRLSTVKSESTGCLYGLVHDDALFVIGLGIELDEECNSLTVDQEQGHGQSELHFPTEVDLCGFVTCSVSSVFTQEYLEDIKQVFVIFVTSV